MIKMVSQAVMLCCLVTVGLLALAEAQRPGGGRPGGPGGGRPGGGRPGGGRPEGDGECGGGRPTDGGGRPSRRGRTPCLQIVTVEGVNTTYDYPCPFSTEDSSLFQCVSGCRPGRPGQEQADPTYMHFCRPSECSTDADCYGDSVCNTEIREGLCTVGREYEMYARACEVQSAGEVVRERPCLGEGVCQTETGRDITIDDVAYTVFFCQRQADDDEQ